MLSANVQIARVVKRMRKLYPREFGQRIRGVIDVNTTLLASKIQRDMMSGPTSKRSLSVRTGRLKRGTTFKPAKMSGGAIVGGVRFKAPYAGVHIGKRGKKIVVRPKTARWLTIPLSAAMTAGGRLRGSAQSGRFKKTYFAKSKKGNLILFGKVGGGEKTLPLFVLKKSVTIRQRIDVKELFRWARRAILADLKAEVRNV